MHHEKAFVAVGAPLVSMIVLLMSIHIIIYSFCEKQMFYLFFHIE